jgi:hypothetical protein
MSLPEFVQKKISHFLPAPQWPASAFSVPLTNQWHIVQQYGTSYNKSIAHALPSDIASSTITGCYLSRKLGFSNCAAGLRAMFQLCWLQRFHQPITTDSVTFVAALTIFESCRQGKGGHGHGGPAWRLFRDSEETNLRRLRLARHVANQHQWLLLFISVSDIEPAGSGRAGHTPFGFNPMNLDGPHGISDQMKRRMQVAYSLLESYLVYFGNFSTRAAHLPIERAAENYRISAQLLCVDYIPSQNELACANEDKPGLGAPMQVKIISSE